MRQRMFNALLLIAVTLPIIATASAAQQTAEKDGTRIGRSSSAMAPEFQKIYKYDAEAKTMPDSTFPYEARVHRAHVVMLYERKILTKADAAARCPRAGC